MTRRYYPYSMMMRAMRTYPPGMHSSKAPDAEQIKEAIRKEVWDLTKGADTLVPISAEEVKTMKKYWQIDWDNTQVQAQEERLRPTLYAQGSGRSTRIPSSREDTSRRIANSADLESNRQNAHLRIHHDTNCSNTRLFMVHNGFQVSVLKRPSTNRRDTHPD